MYPFWKLKECNPSIYAGSKKNHMSSDEEVGKNLQKLNNYKEKKYMRQEKNGVRYFSFQEIYEAKKKKKPNIPEERKQKFLGTCKVCRHSLKYISGTNVVICANEKCNGISIKTKMDGEDITIHKPVFRLLDKRGVEIASTMFE